MNGYTDTIRKWATDIRHAGVLNRPDGIGEIGLGEGEIGRRLAVRFALKRTGEIVDAIRFQVFGCGFTVAACAVAADLAEGLNQREVRLIDARRIDSALDGLPSERSYCADLAAAALQAAVTSCETGTLPVRAELKKTDEHGPRISGDNRVFRLLMDSANPGRVAEEDRSLFAGVIALAAGEPYALTRALGLERNDVRKLLDRYFPAISLDNVLFLSAHATRLPPPVNTDVRQVLHSCVAAPAAQASRWLADILAARAALPGHLWVAMGLFRRPELTAAIRRHLQALAAANDRNMRWKRFLFKRACDLNGGTLCKSPNCGDCSDYSLCFADD